jgi:hypothetical protein
MIDGFTKACAGLFIFCLCVPLIAVFIAIAGVSGVFLWSVIQNFGAPVGM